MTIAATPDQANAPLPVRRLQRTEPLAELVLHPSKVAAMREDLEAGDAFLVPGAIPEEVATRLCSWLADVGRNSLPAWQPIAEGSPNHHRMNNWDERAYVAGCFHQFSFFPWNQDPLDLFAVTRPIYELKNRLSGLAPGSFLGPKPERGCTARISVQLYPRGGGALNQHSDPIGYHQITVPTVLLSQRGTDYQTGGLFVVDDAGKQLDLDAEAGIGDAVYFNARAPHGVADVDPDVALDWLSFSGRWALVAAVNKLSGNTSIVDSRDLEQS